MGAMFVIIMTFNFKSYKTNNNMYQIEQIYRYNIILLGLGYNYIIAYFLLYAWFNTIKL